MSPFLTPPDTVSTARADNYHRVVAYASSVQLARQRLRRSLSRKRRLLIELIVSVMASRSRFQARIGGSESVIIRLLFSANYSIFATVPFNQQEITTFNVFNISVAIGLGD